MLTQTDSRRRITLPPTTGIKPGDTVEIEVLEDGRILLIPMETIPRHQLWAWTADSNFEKLHGMIEPGTGQQLYSLRVTGSTRAVTCLLSGPTLVLVSLHVQHDKAYRKR